MENRSVADLILEAFEQSIRAYDLGRGAEEGAQIEGMSRAVLVARARDRDVPYVERDRLLECLVRQYRDGPRDVWAPAVLEVLAPAMARALVRFGAVEPIADAEDLAQELIAYVLEAALVVPLPEGARWVDKRILMRATGRLNRTVGRESEKARTIRSLTTIAARRRAYQIWRAIDRLSTYPSSRRGRTR